jgi:hypothetical protein
MYHETIAMASLWFSGEADNVMTSGLKPPLRE